MSPTHNALTVSSVSYPTVGSSACLLFLSHSTGSTGCTALVLSYWLFIVRIETYKIGAGQEEDYK